MKETSNTLCLHEQFINTGIHLLLKIHGESEKCLRECVGGWLVIRLFHLLQSIERPNVANKKKGTRHLQPSVSARIIACARYMPASWTSRNMAARKKYLAGMVGVVMLSILKVHRPWRMVVAQCRLLEPEYQNRNDL